MSTKTTKIEGLWRDFILKYRDDPVSFVRDIFQCTPDDWQASVLNDVASGCRRISVRSGHGVGKSTCAAWASLWYVTTRFPVKVVMTAPTASQLYDALFAEVKRWTRLMPDFIRGLFEVKAERIELIAAPNECFISARTSRPEQPEALQGVHADYVMLIADEASGIPEQVFEAAAGSMSGHNAVTLLLGNPVRSTGFFYDTHHRLAGDWRTYHVSCLDSPRVSEDYIKDMARRYGEDSNAYRIRVLGEFPLADDDTVIPMEYIESAWQRDIAEDPTWQEVWGVDIARYGSDKSALVRRKGKVVLEVLQWSGYDLMQSAGLIANLYDSSNPKPNEILVDVIGMGAGVVDRLREQGLPVRGVNVAEAPATKQRFVNLRAELWFEMRDWFATRSCKIPRHEQLIEQLAAVTYTFASNGKIKLEPKDSLKTRLRASPDAADALALTFASRAAALYPRSGGNTSWQKPVKVGKTFTI